MSSGFDSSGFGSSWFDGRRPASASTATGRRRRGAWPGALERLMAPDNTPLTRMMACLAASLDDPDALAPALQILGQTDGTIQIAGYRSQTNDFERDKRILRIERLDRIGGALLEVLIAETMPAEELLQPANLSVLTRAMDGLASREAPQVSARGLYHIAQANENFWQAARNNEKETRAKPSDLGMDHYERILQLNEKHPGCVSRSILAATHFNLGRFRSLTNLDGPSIFSRSESERHFSIAEQLAPGFLEGRSAAEWAYLGLLDEKGGIANDELMREQSALLVAPSVLHGIFKVLGRRKADLADLVARIAQMNLSNRNNPDQLLAAVTAQDPAPFTAAGYETPVGGDRRSDLWRLARFSNHPSVQAAAEVALARTLGQTYRNVQMTHYLRAKTSVPEAMSPQLHAFAEFNIALCRSALEPDPEDPAAPLPDAGASNMAEVRRLAEDYPGRVDRELMGKASYNLAVDQMRPRHPAYDIEAARTNLLLARRYSANPVVHRAVQSRLAEFK